MSELRRDPVTGRWVCLSAGRASRPEAAPGPRDTASQATKDCPFCEGHEHMTPPELMALRPDAGSADSPGWKVRVVPNLYPAFSSEEGSANLADPLHAHGPALGACEVIIHSPDHGRWLPYLADEQAELVMTTTWERYRALRVPGVGSIVALYNHGKEAGASLAHPHGQVYSARNVGPVLDEEYRGADAARRALGACVFCRMIEEETTQGVRVVARAAQFVAIAPYASRQPYECWILPTGHVADFGEIPEDEAAGLGRFLKSVLWRLTAAAGDLALNWYVHSLPNATGDSRESYHWHLEVRPRLTDVAGFELASGTYINTLAPEVAAKNLAARQDPPAGQSEPPG